MGHSDQPVTKASTALPFFYRFVLLYLEPLFALNGAYLTIFTPSEYAASITHSTTNYLSENNYLYTQLGGAWLIFAFNEAVVLQLVDDLRVWKLLCWGMLVSDAVYHFSAVQSFGGWEQWSNFVAWGFFDWAVFASAVAPMLVRIGVVSELGVRKEKGKTQ
ncbi:hypothetical protein QBC42DRAFT_260524 [Cladorrhinum samala]|uniref:DUF7704 domain-containing protein n=1 Tax=Cladorrhinum samala TaxID=585594 RepID=A0AAV9I4G2_9PEZI|nr:hypothetical protein QBC42DRAFT_260524 [Cladorrhinum samala]